MNIQRCRKEIYEILYMGKENLLNLACEKKFRKIYR